MAVDTTRTAPNFRSTSKNSRITVDLGKSRTAFWEAEATVPQTHAVHVIALRAETSFVLPANCRLVDEVVVINNSSIAVDVAVGYSTGATDAVNPASAAATSTVVTAASGTVTRTDRTVFVSAAAYPTAAQGNVHVVLYVREYPPVPDATAIS
jgi:hypothetical protein